MAEHTVTPSTNPISAYLIIIAGVFAISSGAVLIRLAQGEGMPSLLVAAGRVGLAALMLTPLVLQRYRAHLTRLSREDLAFAALSGFFLAIHFVTWVTSLEYTSVLVSVVLVTTTPLWVAVLEFFILKTNLSRLIISGLLIAICGGVIIGLGGAANQSEGETNLTREFIGGALSLAGAVTVSVYLIIGRKLRTSMAIIPYIWLVYGIAGIILAVMVIFSGIPVTGYSTNSYIFLLLLAIIPQLLGHSAINYALGYFPATLVSMGTQLEPIGSAFLAYLLFQEVPFPIQILGSAVILTGVIMATIGQSRNQQKAKG